MSATATSTPTAPATPLKIAFIIGSSREGRFAPVVANWFTARAAEYGGIELDIIDIADLELPTTHPDWGTPRTPELAALAARVVAADGFVVLTPEYNHSFPASLKTFIDLHHTEWEAKAVGFVSYGGVGGGLRAVEQLRLIFTELHCTSVREIVSFHNGWDHFSEGGKAYEVDGAIGAAKVMLDQLTWWAGALRTARASHPYQT
ncbi:NADPH-dependent FMN reductase [Streptomyces sp. NPDC058155]|uniref:NADPH-dependent FMN reductase n=1 Tax=Streptomyces sp. NPDC058155 TaxID=3346359 RepID=UPI0036DFBE66